MWNQGLAILSKLAMDHGVYPTTAAELYEFHWYFETLKDFEKKELMPVIFAADQSEELQQQFVDNVKALFAKLEERWADGRDHVTGANISAADYYILSNHVSVTTNPNLRNPVAERLTAAFEETTHVKRVINNIKSELGEHVNACHAEGRWI